MMFRHRKHWIFDMDGTLTRAIHDFDAIRRALGLALYRPILEQLAEMPEERSRALTARLHEIEYDYALRATAQDGARELLAVLAESGARVGIVTRNSDEHARMTLDAAGLLEYFDAEYILGRDSCEVKPSPDGILKLLSRWRADSADAVMTGDYKFDLIAGREAGTTTVYLDPEDTNEWGEHADTRVNSLHELRRIIEDAG